MVSCFRNALLSRVCVICKIFYYQQKEYFFALDYKFILNNVYRYISRQSINLKIMPKNYCDNTHNATKYVVKQRYCF